MSHLLAIDDRQPMAEMNTTPLIDVMLVLLIMFIITVPLQTHAVKLELPTPGPTLPQPDPIKNKVVVTAAGAILWNGAPVSMPQLRTILEQTAQMRPAPELHVQPEANARYEVVDQVLAVTRQAQVRRMGFVGNERYASF